MPTAFVRAFFNLDLTRRILFPSGYAINGLETAVLECANLCDQKTYIELGANDGIRQSNTKRLEELGWSGILIEPVPKLFRRLTKTRSKSNSFYQRACVPFDFEQDHIEITNLDLMSSSKELVHKDFDFGNQVSSGSKHMITNTRPEKVKVQTATLSELIRESKFGPEFGILSLDVEGAELSVLEGLDLSTHTFEFMIIETSQEPKVTDYLQPFGYMLSRKLSGHDYLFTRQ